MALETLLLDYDAAIRIGLLLGIFTVMALREAVAPLRPPRISKAIRWSNNMALAAVNVALVRVLSPLAAVGVAFYAAEHGAGLLNIFPVPYAVAIPLSFLALDLSVYFLHLLFHAAPVLWRVHRVHHTDIDFDVSTGLRFHPVQIVLAAIVKLATVLLLGPPLLAVITFELASTAITLFNHGNMRMPAWLEQALRWIVVTSDMHLVHHSIVTAETDSNFGFILPWWDRLFGTYRAGPVAGHARMVVGIESFRTERELWLDRPMLNPLLREPAARLRSVSASRITMEDEHEQRFAG